MMTVRRRLRKSRRRKSNNDINKKTRLKRMKRRIIIVLIRKKGQREVAVRKVHRRKASEKYQMMMNMEMTMIPQLRHHLSNRNSKWKTSSKS
jgi:hypothetical protein